MPNRSPKHQIFEHLAAVAKGLGHFHRLDLLELVAQGERSVEGLAKLAGLSVANASQHLQHLRRSGLVRSRKEGLHVYYRVSGEDVIELLRALTRTSERHVAEIDRVVAGYFHARDSLEPVSREELLERFRDGLVTVLDVRPGDEFAAGHVAGAVGIPLKELERRLGELPRGREVIAYCRGPYCVLAFEAVALLRRQGYQARRLEEGYPEWRVEGLPVEETAAGSKGER